MSMASTVNLDYEVINILERILVYLALALTIISMIDFLYKNREIILANK